jgi:tripartite-type tricarboxylate transporter receptor subunit TctC
MKHILALVLVFVSSLVQAKEPITLYVGHGPSQANAAAYLKTVEVANTMQGKYDFHLEFKPGANGALAIKTMDQAPQSRIATVAPAFVENAKSGLLNESEYVAISSQGDACWAIITNFGDTKRGVESMRGKKRVVVGGTGYGNAAHITSIVLGEKYGFDVQYIVYKSNIEGLVAMVGGNGPDFVLERVSTYLNLRDKNPNLQILGINCPNRSALMPEIKTLREQGFSTPTIFFAIVANYKMSKEKRDEIGKILQSAQAQLGSNYFLDTADMFAPQFSKPPVQVDEFFTKRVSQMHYLTAKYKDQIDQSRR